MGCNWGGRNGTTISIHDSKAYVYQVTEPDGTKTPFATYTEAHSYKAKSGGVVNVVAKTEH